MQIEHYVAANPKTKSTYVGCQSASRL